MEEINYIEDRSQPKIGKITLGEYVAYNYKLSIAKGWKIGNDTERSKHVFPQLIKINRQFDEEGNELSYDLAVLVKVSSEEQEKYSKLITFDLYDQKDYVPADERIENFIATGLTTEQTDWILQHCSIQFQDGVKTIWLEDEARSSLSDEAVQALNDLGVTVMTVQ